MKSLILLLLIFPVSAFAQTPAEQVTDSIKYYQRAAAKARIAQDYKTCIDDYSKLIKIDPKNINTYANRASAKTDLKDYEGAINDYTIAAKLDERYRWTYYNSIGISKLAEKNFNGAIKYYDKSISIHPYDGTLANRGNAWMLLGNYKRAIKDYTEAIDLQNIDTAKYLNISVRSYHYTSRGKAEALNGDFKAALADFNTSLRLRPDDAWTYNGRGEAKNQLGDNAGACADWQTAIRLGSGAATENVKKYCNK